MLHWKQNILLWYQCLFSNKPQKGKLHFIILLNVYQIIVTILLFIIFLILWILTPASFMLENIFTGVSFACSKISFKRKKPPRTNSGELQISNSKITLFLDLDQTLVFTTTIKIAKAKNYAIIENQFYVYTRPHLDTFLATLSQICELNIYTAGTKEYADKVINHIDKNKLIHRRYYRQDCILINNSWYKDVSKYSSDERKLLVIDDTPEIHLSLKDNIIPIKAWYGKDERDDSLMKIKNIIKNFTNGGRANMNDIVISAINNDV